MRHARAAALALIAAAAIVSPPPARAAAGGGDEPRLTLLSPGRPPLKALRYRLQPGHRGSITMSMTTSMAMSIGGQAVPAAPSPEIRCRMDYLVTGITPQGDIRYEFEMGSFEALAEPSVAPQALESTRAALSALKGLRGHAVVTARGIMREGDIEMPAGAPPPLRAMTDSLRQSVRQFSAPLPEEPVGAGARWDTTYRLDLNGVTFDQTGHNELRALDGDRGRLAITITQTAAPQPIRNPALPPDTRMDLVSMSSAGEAEAAFDLTRLVPSSASVKMKMQMKMRIQLPKQAPQDADTTVETSMSLTGR